MTYLLEFIGKEENKGNLTSFDLISGYLNLPSEFFDLIGELEPKDRLEFIAAAPEVIPS
jgi:hypothetical protein